MVPALYPSVWLEQHAHILTVVAGLSLFVFERFSSMASHDPNGRSEGTRGRSRSFFAASSTHSPVEGPPLVPLDVPLGRRPGTSRGSSAAATTVSDT